MKKYRIVWENVYGTEAGEDIVEAKSDELAIAYWNLGRSQRNAGIIEMEELKEKDEEKKDSQK